MVMWLYDSSFVVARVWAGWDRYVWNHGRDVGRAPIFAVSLLPSIHALSSWNICLSTMHRDCKAAELLTYHTPH